MKANQSEARKEELMKLATELATRNPLKRFDDHCYLRMAYDHALQTRWDTQIKRPAVRHLSDEQYWRAVGALKEMLDRPAIIGQYNEASLKFRKER